MWKASRWRVCVGFHAAHLVSISASLQIWKKGKKKRGGKVERRESESAWKVSMVTFVSLCLIAYVILLLVTLHPACRPAVYSVLVTLPPTLLLVCSFLLSTHSMIWSFQSLPTSSSSNTLPCRHISPLLPLSNLKSTPSPLSSNHFSCLFLQFQVTCLSHSTVSKTRSMWVLTDRDRPLTECAWGMWRTAVQAQSSGQVQVVRLDWCRLGLSVVFKIQTSICPASVIMYKNIKMLQCAL